MNQSHYVRTVLTAYTGLSDTPNRPRPNDRRLVRKWFLKGVPLEHIEAAFTLATVRRSIRPSTATPLPPIRSLFYFELIIDEIKQTGLDLEYVRCLRERIPPAQVHLPPRRHRPVPSEIAGAPAHGLHRASPQTTPTKGDPDAEEDSQ